MPWDLQFVYIFFDLHVFGYISLRCSPARMQSSPLVVWFFGHSPNVRFFGGPIGDDEKHDHDDDKDNNNNNNNNNLNLTIRLLKTHLFQQKKQKNQGALKKRGALPGFHSPTACQRLYMATQLAIERNAKVLHAAGHGAVNTRSQNLLQLAVFDGRFETFFPVIFMLPGKPSVPFF